MVSQQAKTANAMDRPSMILDVRRLSDWVKAKLRHVSESHWSEGRSVKVVEQLPNMIVVVKPGDVRSSPAVRNNRGVGAIEVTRRCSKNS